MTPSSMDTTSSLLEGLPLELLYEIASLLDHHDLRNLRLVSKVGATLGIHFMLRTFPFRYGFDGVTRMAAFAANAHFSRQVHTLALSTRAERETRLVPPAEIDVLAAKHVAMVKQLARKYLDARFERSRAHPLEAHAEHLGVLKSALRDSSPGEIHPDSCQLCLYNANAILVLDLVRIMSASFPHLRHLLMIEDHYVYDLEFPGQLRVSDTNPSTIAFPFRQPSPWGGEVISQILDKHPKCGNQESALTLEMNITSIARCRRFASSILPSNLEHVLDKVQRLSLKYSNFATQSGEPNSPAPITPGEAFAAIYLGHQPFHRGPMKKLEELEIRCPYGYATLRDALYRRNGFLVPLAAFRVIHFPHIRKLDLAFIAIHGDEFPKVLEGWRATLRSLKLTRIDLVYGTLRNLFRNIRYSLDRLESAEFCDFFYEAWGDASIMMEQLVTDDEDHKGGDVGSVVPEYSRAFTTVGSKLGEICLAQTPLDSPLRKAALWLLLTNMWSRTVVEWRAASGDFSLKLRKVVV